MNSFDEKESYLPENMRLTKVHLLINHSQLVLLFQASGDVNDRCKMGPLEW